MSGESAIQNLRGIFDGFCNFSCVRLMARASVEKVAEALATAFDVTSRHEQITEWPCPCEPLGNSRDQDGTFHWNRSAVALARLAGHEWTQILEAPGFYIQGLGSTEGARRLSEQLAGDVLMLAYEDHANFHGYELFRGGKSVEYFEGGWGEDRFRSSLGREAPAEMAELDFDPIEFMEEVVTDLEAYVPMAILFDDDEEGCTLNVFVDDEPLSADDMERVDLLIINGDSLPTSEQSMSIDGGPLG